MMFHGICFDGGFAYCNDLAIIHQIIKTYAPIFMQSYATAAEAYDRAFRQFVDDCSKSNQAIFVCPPDMDKMGPNTVFHTPYVWAQPQQKNGRFFAITTMPYYGIYTDVTSLMTALRFMDECGLDLVIKETVCANDALTFIRRMYLRPAYYHLPETRYRAVPIITIDKWNVLYESPFNTPMELPMNYSE